MARVRIKNKGRFVAAIAVLLAIVLALALGVGWLLKHKGGTPSKNNTNNTVPADNGSPNVPDNSSQNAPDNTSPNTPDNSSPNTPDDTAPDDQGKKPPEDDPIRQRAAKMQDYTINSETGMAKEISKVDDNYLLLVNRTHPLAQSYKPGDMVTVKSVVSNIGSKGETDQLRKVAADAFEAMVAAAAKDGINIKMRTGFRSYEYQRDRLYNPYVKQYGQKEADKFSAKPGQSEHQTGLALDIGGESQKYALSREFGNTKEGIWVAEHCHEYGFIIRYTDGTKDTPGKTTGYISEPWHLRYVGVEAAAKLVEGGWLLEEYLGVLE